MKLIATGCAATLCLWATPEFAAWDGPGYYVVMTADQEKSFIYGGRYSSEHFCKYDADALDRRSRGELLFGCWLVEEKRYRSSMENLSEADIQDIEKNYLKPR